MREQPIQQYYPSIRLRLIVRFEDFGSNDTPSPPAKPPHLRTANDAQNRLRIEQYNGAFILLAEGQQVPANASYAARDTSSDGRTFAIDNIIPAELVLNRNGVRQADTLSASIRFKDLPLDPRTLRAIAVEVYIGTLDPEKAAQAQLGAGNWVLCPDFFYDEQGRERSNRRFSGWIDEWRIEFEGEPLIQFEATDNTRQLIDQDAPPKIAVPPELPIDRAIAEYLSNFPQFAGILVEYRPNGDTRPNLESTLTKSAYKPKLGPTPSSGGTSKMSVWDYLTDVCGTIGHIVRVEGETVVIQRARTLYGQRFPGRPGDPFRGRDLPTGRILQRRLFVLGRNIEKLRFARRFGRYAATNIEVRCYSPEAKRTLVGRYPVLKEDRNKQVQPGNAGSEQVWKVYTVQGVKDEVALRKIAQNIYELVQRNELEVEFETINLGSMGGSNFDPDCLDCEAGDAVDVEVVRDFDSEATRIEAETALATRTAAYLKQIGFDDAFAAAYASIASELGMTTSFRVKNLSIQWSIDEGIRLSFTCINYLEVRADKILPGDEEPSAVEGNADTTLSPLRTEAGPRL